MLPFAGVWQWVRFILEIDVNDYRAWLLLLFLLPLGIILGIYAQTFVQGAFYDIQ